MAKTVDQLPPIVVDTDKVDLGALLDLEEAKTIRQMLVWFTTYTNLTDVQVRSLAPNQLKVLAKEMGAAMDQQFAVPNATASN